MSKHRELNGANDRHSTPPMVHIHLKEAHFTFRLRQLKVKAELYLKA